MPLKFAVALALAVLLLPAGLHASFEEGVAAWERGEFTKAFRELKDLAEQGHAAAQYNVGVMYTRGEGTRRDPEEAAFWYRKAAVQGNAAAQNNLGVLYNRGEGVSRDLEEAVFWYRWAADQGYPAAQHNLGLMYEHGLGVKQDDVEAYKWYDLAAAEEGNEASRQAREKISGRMTAARIAAARKLSRLWRPAAPAPTRR
jgi:TPR repeat protein